MTIGGIFTVNDKEYDGNTDATINQNSLALIGIVNSDDVFLANVELDFEQSQVGSNILVSITNASLNGTRKDNYSLSLDNSPTAYASILNQTSIMSHTDFSPSIINPFNSKIQIINAEQVSTVKIKDKLGKLVFEGVLNGSEIDVSYLSSGIYFIDLIDVSGKSTQIKGVKL